MRLPPFVYAKAFWEALSLIASGVLGLLVLFQKIPAQYGLSAGAILVILLGILRFFGVNPELKLKGVVDAFNEQDEIYRNIG